VRVIVAIAVSLLKQAIQLTVGTLALADVDDCEPLHRPRN
jgi:hypothetical protein